MRNIVTNAPIQNQDFNPDLAPGKVIPLFVADWLRQQSDTHPGVAIDLWNDVISAEQFGQSAEAYTALSDERIREKYQSRLLQSREHSEVTVLRDSDENFHGWAKSIVRNAIKRGIMRTEIIEVNACDNCDETLNLSLEPCTNACANCHHIPNPYTATRPMLVADKTDVTEAQVFASTSKPQSPSANKTVAINKIRLSGVDLTEFGFSNQTLDPRVGLGLLALYAADTQHADSITLVASHQTLDRNLSTFFAALGELYLGLPDLRMRGIAKAPIQHLMYLRAEGVIAEQGMQRIVSDILPPALLTSRQDMSPAHFEQIVFSRKRST